jgi:hypothetical protein
MAAVSENIVREYFELHGFLLRQYRKYVAPAGREDDDIDFLAINPHLQTPEVDLPFVLGSSDLPFIERAIIVIKAWHTGVFSPALLTNAPRLFRFLEKRRFQKMVREFGQPGKLLKILIVPGLPHDAEARDQSIAILRAKGIDAVLSFRTMLAELVSKVEASRNYQKSDLLQLIRILKTYEFLKEPQMELFKAKPKRARRISKSTASDSTQSSS